ncbi:hypothetical protein T492DRAFT_904948 [Pavlovales sp. CCMP2436]|nr:hypothetical protein T492DRAFT_904948 [Pavlovales sp. CCMP2436]|mmetsp:Transcript_48516/g.113561  ORF Transcript_48516/g.113561 Transcript_48516/m.113561 type:complete len:130 (+) Transcript_48516:33-422(+)
MGRAITRAVISCMRCSEPSLVGGLPRCGCFVHSLIVAPSASAIALLDGAPRRPRRVRVSAAARARRRGVLARDAVTRYNPLPRWFSPAGQAPPVGKLGAEVVGWRTDSILEVKAILQSWRALDALRPPA